MYGQRLPIKSNKEYDITEDKFFIIKELIENGEHFWIFDEYGNRIYLAKPNELPLDYQFPGVLYIKIKDFNFTQNNIESFTCYKFEIYMYGNKINSASDFFAYSDIVDCLSRARILIKQYKETFLNFFQNPDNYISPSGLIIDTDIETGISIINPEM